ncbi:MAG TPA: energy transducer TonB [Polyangium sp.]|nr:energy transducer TonB [Polyangium sp.]
MVQLPRIRIVVLGLVYVTLVACASGPEKPNPSPPIAAEDANLVPLDVPMTDVPMPNVQKVDAESTGAKGTDVEKTDAPEYANVTIPFGPGMSRPTLIAGLTPSLPPIAIAKGVTGTWIGRCIITEQGSVEGCEVIKGLPESNEHICQSIQAQKYTPIIFEGKPQRVFYQFKITFR